MQNLNLMMYAPLVPTLAQGYFSFPRVQPRDELLECSEIAPPVERRSADSILEDLIVSKEESPEFIKAACANPCLEKGSFESTLSQNHFERHGEFVRIAYGRCIEHDAIVADRNLGRLLDLSADSFYQFNEERGVFLGRIFKALGCSELQGVLLDNAISSTLSTALRSKLTLPLNDHTLDEFAKAIKYARNLHTRFSNLSLSVEVARIVRGLEVLNGMPDRGFMYDLGREHYNEAVRGMQEVFNRELKLINPIIESHCNSAHKIPFNLETVYLFPALYESHLADRAGDGGIALKTFEDLRKFYDSFRAVLESDLEKQCPRVNKHIGIACIQEAAAFSVHDWWLRKAGYVVGKVGARGAALVAHMARAAALWVP